MWVEKEIKNNNEDIQLMTITGIGSCAKNAKILTRANRKKSNWVGILLV